MRNSVISRDPSSASESHYLAVGPSKPRVDGQGDHHESRHRANFRFNLFLPPLRNTSLHCSRPFGGRGAEIIIIDPLSFSFPLGRGESKVNLKRAEESICAHLHAGLLSLPRTYSFSRLSVGKNGTESPAVELRVAPSPTRLSLCPSFSFLPF